MFPALPTREALGYRGLVREVLERAQHRPGWVITTRWRFARDGKPLTRDVVNGDGSEFQDVFSYGANDEWIRPNVSTVRGADGSFTEYWVLGPLERSGRMAFCPVPAVPIGFFVQGAAVVETAYGPDGRRLGVRFRAADGAEVSEFAYRFDNHGRVVEAKQFSKFETGPLGKADPALALFSYGEQAVAEVTLEYGSRGELLSYQTTLGGMTSPPAIWTYNEHGDVASKSRLGEPEVRFEYAYDDRGNWVRQVPLVEAKPGFEAPRSETLRSLSYNPDAP